MPRREVDGAARRHIRDRVGRSFVNSSHKAIVLQLDCQGFRDKGIDRVPDDAEARACVNGLLLNTF